MDTASRLSNGKRNSDHEAALARAAFVRYEACAIGSSSCSVGAG
jgi:hypothetical protein